jgi:monoamine oxidase
MMIDAKRKNIEFKHNYIVNRVELHDNTYNVTALNKTGSHIFQANRVILAVTRNALQMIFPFSPEHPLIKATAMEPLLRIYSVYRNGNWFPKTKVVTNSVLRMIIPIDKEKGIIMSAYLDGRDIELWSDLYKKDKLEELKEKVHNETQALFPDLNIDEKPQYISAEYWSEGCTYWKTGIDYKKMSENALQPYPNSHPNLHIIGESFSLKQQWIEGALEHADSLITMIESQISEKKNKSSQ